MRMYLAVIRLPGFIRLRKRDMCRLGSTKWGQIEQFIEFFVSCPKPSCVLFHED